MPLNRHSGPARSRRFGVTLLEVITSLVIVAAVSSVIIPTVFQRLRESRVDTIVAELKSLETAIMLFRQDVGRYPRRLEYLAVQTLPTN